MTEGYGPQDINLNVLASTIRKMENEFYTQDVYSHPDMLNAHRFMIGDFPGNYHISVGKRIAQEFEGRWLVRLLRNSHRTKGMKWEKSGDWRSDEPVANMSNDPSLDSIQGRQDSTYEWVREKAGDSFGQGHNKKLIREGHWLALDYMEHPMFLEVKGLFERYSEIGGVYFRPTDGGVTVVDLHPESPKPRIGVGENAVLPPGTQAGEIAPTMRDRIDYLKQVRSRQKNRSQENQLETYLIRDAQENHLKLPGFPDRLRFVHSQWCIHLTGGQKFTDLIAVDLESKHLVVIELKTGADPAAFSQVQSYLGYFQDHADELNPFFFRLARIMGRIYDCPELAELDTVETAAAGLVAWPEGGQVMLQNPDELDKLGPFDAPSHPEKKSIDLDPQYTGDDPFKARMRLHQSWYRAHVLGVPCGTGPKDTDTKYYGNMLRPEDGASGLNFLTPEIFQVAKRRIAESKGVVEPFRLLHNMLSSQPMCFNLFGLLVDDLDLATALWQALFPGEVQRVTRVCIEYAPEPAGEYLNDRTAFDAYVEYRDVNDRMAFTGIEVKLTEPFSQKHYDGPAYRRWMELPDSPWRPEAWDKVDRIEYNQLWRDHLLAIAMVRHPDSTFRHGRLMLIRHPDDSNCSQAVQDYNCLLKDGDRSFFDRPLDKLVEIWQKAILSDTNQRWLEMFSQRYLNLKAK